MNDISLAAMKRRDDAYCLLLDLCYVCRYMYAKRYATALTEAQETAKQREGQSKYHSLSLEIISTPPPFLPHVFPVL